MRSLLSTFNSNSPFLFLLKGMLYAGAYILLHVSICNYWIGQKDYAWGETRDFRSRLAHLRKNAASYNAVFVGSSIVKNHVNPCVFDSVASKYHPIKSFNLGSNGMFVPTSFSIVEKIIRDSSFKLEYIFLDYDFINDIGRFIQNPKAYYWIDRNYLQFTIASTLHSTLSPVTKCRIIYQYTRAFIEKNMAFGQKSNLINRDFPSDELDPFETAHRGYWSLDHQLEQAGSDTGGLLKTRRIGFLNDTTRLAESMISARKVAAGDQPINEPFINKLIALIDIAKSRHIQLIYLFQPRNADKEIYAEFNRIPPSNKIDVALDPALYKAGYHFDNRHLNDSGAAYFSALVAREFVLIDQ